jgi:hypothetical protein
MQKHKPKDIFDFVHRSIWLQIVYDENRLFGRVRKFLELALLFQQFGEADPCFQAHVSQRHVETESYV